MPDIYLMSKAKGVCVITHSDTDCTVLRAQTTRLFAELVVETYCILPNHEEKKIEWLLITAPDLLLWSIPPHPMVEL
jgi:hypothetical protein